MSPDHWHNSKSSASGNHHRRGNWGQGMQPYKRPGVVFGAFSIAALLLLAYNHSFMLLVRSSSAQKVTVTAQLPARAGLLGSGHNGLASRPNAATPLGSFVKHPVSATATTTEAPEVWAAGPKKGLQQQQLLRMLDAGTLAQLKSLCGRCLYRTLTSYVQAHDFGRVSVVLTGDIPAMWVRDSAVQMASYFPRIGRRPALRQTLEGAIQAQCYFVLQVSCVCSLQEASCA